MTPESTLSTPQHPRNRITTQDLTPSQLRLVQLMTEFQFGRIEDMRVEGGLPVLDRSARVVRVARLGGETGGMSDPSNDGFELKRSVCDLFNELARLQNGTVVRLEFRHGLPFLLEIVETTKPAGRPAGE
jgi:hypothetical protein